MPMSITEVKTLNSVYQIDVENQKVRKLSGLNSDTANQSKTDADGWRHYIRLTTYGSGLVIIWDVEEVNGEQILRRTFTSEIVSIEGELETPEMFDRKELAEQARQQGAKLRQMAWYHNLSGSVPGTAEDFNLAAQVLEQASKMLAGKDQA